MIPRPTVSTLAEAEAFAAAGYTNLLYAVGIAPHKLPRAAALMAKGVNLHILLDSEPQATAVAEYGQAHGFAFSVFYRSGLATATGADCRRTATNF
ncbi:Predicted amino acid aldolase or racemase [Cedecea neteri]|uniref:Predicted amino acid aldolase or racemase n=1 Tax=Cedecea neteri TaxID=158822 RepID=A0A2X3JBE9_9ENTR|nr:Predicted amino acid aldolase or racemase [Cedecea neteri]